MNKLVRVSKKLLIGGTVSVGTVGLSTCNDNGAVDPAPPPLQCDAVADGGPLFGQGQVDGTTLAVTIDQGQFFDAQWSGTPEIVDVQNAAVDEVRVDGFEFGPVVVRFTLDAPDTAAVTFTLRGALVQDGTSCPVERTFTATIADGAVDIAMRGDDLPLGARDRATIAMVRRDGLEVELAPHRGVAGGLVAWTVTGGRFDPVGDGIVWRLPERAGLYQAELLVDYGRDGFAFDTLTLEVSGPTTAES